MIRIRARDAYVKNLATNDDPGGQPHRRRDGTVANAGAAAVAVSGDGTRIGIGMDSGAIAPDLDPRHGVGRAARAHGRPARPTQSRGRPEPGRS